jgi:subfamily B ATP-binding cassette protein MsbA
MQVAQAATRVLMILVRDSVIVVGLLSYMLWLDWRLSLVVFLLLPLLVLVVRIIARRLRGLSRQLQDNVGRMTHALEESVRGHKVVKLYGGEAMERERFARLANWTRRLMFKEKVADAASMPLVEANAALMIGLLIYLGTGQSGGAPMSVGAFVSFLAALGLLFPPIKRLTQVNHPLQRGLAGAETIFAMIDEVAEAETGARQIKRAQGRLSFDQVRFRYPGAERNALDGISFDLEPGRTLALVGPSGGGKTSIAALIPRFYDPDWGSVLLDGQDIRAYSRRDLRNQIAYVGQEAVLFNDTVARNIGYGIAPPPDAARLREAARRAHALEFIEALSQGFDTPIGEQGLRLSGGQRQRIAIARALIRDAPILILDEATSALDTHAEAEVQAALAELARDRATLVIAHRLSTIEHADRILVIRDGRVVEAGTHAELLAAGGEYHSLHSRQFRNEGL